MLDVDIRLRGSVHYDKSNMYGHGSNQKFNMYKSSMCQMRYLVSNNRHVILHKNTNPASSSR